MGSPFKPVKKYFFIPQLERNSISDFRLRAIMSTIFEHDEQSFTVARWRDLLQYIVDSRNEQGPMPIQFISKN